MFRHRLATGVAAGAFAILAISFLPAAVLIAILLVLYVLATLEFQNMANAAGLRRERLGEFLCGAAYLATVIVCYGPVEPLGDGRVLLPWFGCRIPEEALLAISPFNASIIVPAFFLVQQVLRGKTERAVESVGTSMLGFWYIPVLMTFLFHLVFDCLTATPRTVLTEGANTEATNFAAGRFLLLYFLATVKFGDIGAYTFGMTLRGRFPRKLIPSISPKKSVVGLFGAFFGSVLASLVAGVLYRHVFHHELFGETRFCYVHLVVLGVLLGGAGLLGDLVESLFKRSFRVKDSANSLPGLGGVLDVLDSVLFAAPVLYFYLKRVF